MNECNPPTTGNIPLRETIETACASDLPSQQFYGEQNSLAVPCREIRKGKQICDHQTIKFTSTTTNERIRAKPLTFTITLFEIRRL